MSQMGINEMRETLRNEPVKPGSSGARGSTANSDMTNFGVEYEHNGQTWRTVVEAYDREHAYQRFQRDNPHAEIISVD